MRFPDCLLQIDSYPEPTPHEAIEQALGFCRTIGASLTALATHVHFLAPRNWLAEQMLNVSKLAEAEEEKSLEAARSALNFFNHAAKIAGVPVECLLERANINAVGDYVAARARTRDLCLVPVQDAEDGQRLVGEDVIFGSGRPTLIFKPGVADLPTEAVGEVVVAWDGSRCAARALADALPVLAVAREVRLLTILNEKSSTRSGAARDAVRHLKAHGVDAAVEEIDAAGRRIGVVFDDYIERRSPDLLVMGAYGRSKIREFILGGATEHLLSAMKVPLFLSH